MSELQYKLNENEESHARFLVGLVIIDLGLMYGIHASKKRQFANSVKTKLGSIVVD